MTFPSTHLYCPMCGAPYLPAEKLKFHKTCHACGYVFYENLRTSAGALIIESHQILLVKRAIKPRLGAWDVPGGFTEPNEHPETSVRREIKEELGVSCKIIRLFGVYAPNPYLFHGKINYVCDLFYLVSLPQPYTLHPADDIASFRWFPLKKLPPPAKLAFPTTRHVLKDLSLNPI